jgi:RNA-splicing ligase RtcB
VVRFVVKNTVDTDMQAMQERKTREIDSVVGRKWPKLSVTDLIDLFSERKRQAEDEPYGEEDDERFVFPDDPYDKADEDSDIEMNDIN